MPASAERARATVSRCRQWYPVAVGSPAAATAAATCSATLRSAARGFSTKNGNPARTTDSSSSPCANGGTHNQTASSPRVSRSREVGDVPGAHLSGQRLGGRRHGVADADEVDVVEAGQGAGVPGADATGPHEPHPDGHDGKVRVVGTSPCGSCPLDRLRGVDPVPRGRSGTPCLPAAETRWRTGRRSTGRTPHARGRLPVAQPPDLHRHGLPGGRAGGRQAGAGPNGQCRAPGAERGTHGRRDRRGDPPRARGAARAGGRAGRGRQRLDRPDGGHRRACRGPGGAGRRRAARARPRPRQG